VQLRLENATQRPRRLTVTYYAEWVLGPDREAMKPFVVPEYNENDGYALLAFNHYNKEFTDRVAFMGSSEQPAGLTADRREFLGVGGTLRNPAALHRIC
jgi:cellobiose phosphorylase